MPTIALVNGHAFGAGVFLATAHDYRIQNPSRGFICLPEIDLGMLIPNPFQVMFQKKLTPSAYRTALLEGQRLGGPAALDLEIVDALGGLEEAVKFVQGRKLVGKGGVGTVWGGLKESAWRDVLLSIEKDDEYAAWREALEKSKVESRKIGKKKVDAWEEAVAKAKI
jgi:enoyl-CoA hydratase/carnithine racemase